MGKDEEAEFEEELDLNADVNDDDDDLMLDEDFLQNIQKKIRRVDFFSSSATF